MGLIETNLSLDPIFVCLSCLQINIFTLSLFIQNASFLCCQDWQVRGMKKQYDIFLLIYSRTSQ